MTQYMICYFGGNPPKSEEEGKASMEKYQRWLGDLGDKAISPMNPLRANHTITADGNVSDASAVRMSGFTVVEAESIEEAVEITKSCPFLEIGGTLEVAELISMD